MSGAKGSTHFNYYHFFNNFNGVGRYVPAWRAALLFSFPTLRGAN